MKSESNGSRKRAKFFCLAYTDQEKSPTSEASQDELFRAGLGQKEILFEDANIL